MKTVEHILEVIFSRVTDRDLCRIIWGALDGEDASSDTQHLFKALWVPEFYFVLEGRLWSELLENGSSLILANPEDYLSGIAELTSMSAYRDANVLPGLFSCDSETFALAAIFFEKRQTKLKDWATITELMFLQLELAVFITSALANCIRQAPMEFVDKIERIYSSALSDGVFLGDIALNNVAALETSWVGVESQLFKGVVSYVEEATEVHQQLIERVASVQDVYHLLIAMCSDLPESCAGVVMNELGNDIDRVIAEVRNYWGLRETARYMSELIEKWSTAALSIKSAESLFDHTLREHESLISAMQAERFVDRYAILIRELGQG